MTQGHGNLDFARGAEAFLAGILATSIYALCESLGQAGFNSNHGPAPIPAGRFWSFTVYDNQTRSMLETDQAIAGLDSTLPA